MVRHTWIRTLLSARRCALRYISAGRAHATRRRLWTQQDSWLRTTAQPMHAMQHIWSATQSLSLHAACQAVAANSDALTVHRATENRPVHPADAQTLECTHSRRSYPIPKDERPYTTVTEGRPVGQHYGIGAQWVLPSAEWNRTQICGVGSPCLTVSEDEALRCVNAQQLPISCRFASASCDVLGTWPFLTAAASVDAAR